MVCENGSTGIGGGVYNVSFTEQLSSLCNMACFLKPSWSSARIGYGITDVRSLWQFDILQGMMPWLKGMAGAD